MNHFTEDYGSLTLQAGKKLEWCQETNLRLQPLPKDQVRCTGSLTGTATILLEAKLLALEMTNIHIHLLDLTAIFDTGMTEFILQAWQR